VSIEKRVTPSRARGTLAPVFDPWQVLLANAGRRPPAPTDHDFEDQVRGFDDPSEVNGLVADDLGADEWRPELFADGFETGNTLRWSSDEP